MSLAQQLLLRALVARFWREPYAAAATRLTRWGTELHDRFLLPHFVQMDFDDVIAELRGAGFALRRGLVRAALRVPLPAASARWPPRGVELTLRSALEPWHVMGEEGAPGGTVRYVDSSLERLEVKVSGLNDNRHVVTVNGRALPLQPTGRVGEFVCGVRYRAWQPAVGAAPDDRRARAAHLRHRRHAGCSARSAAATTTWRTRAGAATTTFPVNAYEAESRRLARFFAHGPHAGARWWSQPRSRAGNSRSRSTCAWANVSPSPRR